MSERERGMGRETTRNIGRRGVIAATAAFAAALLAKQAAEPVGAVNGTLALGNDDTTTNVANNTTILAVTTVTTGGLRIVNPQTPPAPQTYVFDATQDAVQGFAAQPNPNPNLLSNSGVHGRNDGVQGIGTTGVSSNGTGVYGQSTTGTGVGGLSTSQAGVYGQTLGVGNGVVGISSSGYGVVGFTTGGSASLAGITTNAAIPAFAGGTSITNGLAAHFTGTVFVDCATSGGAFVVSPMSAKNGLLKHPDGTHRLMYCLEAPESLAHDYGTGKLVNGRADVTIDPDFAPLIESDYMIFLTEYDGHNDLYVTQRTPTGFAVRSKDGTGNNAFAWQLVVKPKSDKKVERLATFEPPVAKLPDPQSLRHGLPKRKP